MRYLIFVSLLALTSCFQKYGDEADLRAVPVTNNPNVVPNYGSGMPGFGGGGPY